MQKVRVIQSNTFKKENMAKVTAHEQHVWNRKGRSTQDMVRVGFEAWALEPDCLDSDLLSTAQRSCDLVQKFAHLQNEFNDGTKLTGLL